MGLVRKRTTRVDPPSDTRDDPTGSPAPGPEISDRFTELAAAVVAAASGPAMGAFWKAVYELDEWHFLPSTPHGESVDEAMDRGRPLGPIIAQLEGKQFVAAFTSEARALACAKANGLAAAGAGFGILSMSMDDGAAYLCQLTDDTADGVIFNHNQGEAGMTAPLDNVAAMYEYHLDRIQAPMFDRFVRAVTAANSPQVWARLNRRFAEMERLYFIGDTDRPQSPQLFVHEESVCALLFTDEQHAGRGAGVIGGGGEEGRIPLISTTPRDAAVFLAQLREHSAAPGHPVKDVVINLGSQPFVMSIDDLVRFVGL